MELDTSDFARALFTAIRLDLPSYMRGWAWAALEEHLEHLEGGSDAPEHQRRRQEGA